jgi:hypothetical protein
VTVAMAAGAILACVAAIAASPLMPIGPARLAELHPGVSVDWPVFAAGFAATVVLLAGRVCWTAWRELARAGRAAPQLTQGRPGLARRLSGIGVPVTAVTGIRLALERGRGRTAAPVLSAIFGTGLSVAAVMASLTFGANLAHLERTPALYGQNWDAAMDMQFGALPAAQFERYIKSVPGITGWTFGVHGTITLAGRPGVVPAVGLARGHGPLLAPTLLAGHLPRGREVVLGTSTMRSGGYRIGQSVRLTGQRLPVTVVGRATFPSFAQGSFTPTDLGLGALVPASLLMAQADEASGAHGYYNFVLLKFAPGADKAAVLAAFRRATARYCVSVQQSTCVLASQTPAGIVYYQRINATPLLLAGLLAVLGLGLLAHFMVQSARTRGRDFAVLRTLGLQRRQLTALLIWQVCTLTAIAVLTGIPVGAAAGHWAWALFADVLGVPPGTSIPVGTGLLLIPAALLAANLVALWPARRNLRFRPAQLLRAE